MGTSLAGWLPLFEILTFGRMVTSGEVAPRGTMRPWCTAWAFRTPPDTAARAGRLPAAVAGEAADNARYAARATGALAAPKRRQKRSFLGYGDVLAIRSPSLGLGARARVCTPSGQYGSNGPGDFVSSGALRGGPGGRLVLPRPHGGHVPDLLDDLGVGQSGHVPELPAFGNVAEQPAHDLPGTGLGKVVSENDGVRPGDLADHLGNMFAKLRCHGLVPDLAAFE